MIEEERISCLRRRRRNWQGGGGNEDGQSIHSTRTKSHSASRVILARSPIITSTTTSWLLVPKPIPVKLCSPHLPLLTTRCSNRPWHTCAESYHADRGIITILSILYCHFTAATLALRRKRGSRILNLPDDYGMYSYSVERASLVEIEAYRSWTKWGSRTTQTVFLLLSASTLCRPPFRPGMLPLTL